MEKAEAHARALNRQGVIDEMNRVALATKSPTAILNSRMMANKLYADQLAQEQKDATKSVQMGYGGFDPFQRKMVVAKSLKGVSRDKIDPVERRAFDSISDYDASIRQFRSYLKKLGRMGKKGVALELVPKAAWTNQMHAINADRDELIATMVRAKSGVAARPDEHRRLAALMPRARETADARAQKVEQVYQKAIETLEGRKRALAAIGKTRLIPAIDEQIAEMKRDIKGAIRDAKGMGDAARKSVGVGTR
jgi:hypothetical protein